VSVFRSDVFLHGEVIWPQWATV